MFNFAYMFTQPFLPLLLYSRFLIKGTYGVYTRLMEAIYLSLRAQVAVGTFFMKSPVPLVAINTYKWQYNNMLRYNALINSYNIRNHCTNKSYWMKILDHAMQSSKKLDLPTLAYSGGGASGGPPSGMLQISWKMPRKGRKTSKIWDPTPTRDNHYIRLC